MKAVLVICALCFVSAFAVEFSGHQVLRFSLTSQEDFDELQKYVEKYRLDMWETNAVEGWADVMVPAEFHTLENQLPPFEYEVYIPDVQSLIDAQRIVPDAAGFFEEYQTLSSIQSFLKNLSSQFPQLVSYIELGKSVEGNEIFGVTITGKGNSSKPGIFYNGGQHAREWISPATVSYIANEWVTKYGVDSEITKLVDSFEWTLVPVVNTDGYLYTFSDNRLWRKNRRKEGFFCYGVDINRNWGYKWNTGGSSGQPCSDTYHGPSAFSEPEEQAVTRYITAHTNIVGYIDFHSYSQLWMNPWGWTSSETPKDNTDQLKLAALSTKAIKDTHGMEYQYGNVAKTIYVASGGSLDWTYGAGNVKYSYAVELRDTGRYGFMLPPDQIIPTGQEIVAAARAMGSFILSQG